MGFKQIPRIPVGCRSYIAHTADLSAFAGYSTIPVNLLNFIIGPNRHPPK